MSAYLRAPGADAFVLPGWPALDKLVRVDERIGAVTARIPLPVSTGRFGFTPTLALLYSSTRHNSPFGYGWGLDVPSIARRTWPEMPRYREADDDTFVLENGGSDEQRHGEQGHVGQGEQIECHQDDAYAHIDPAGDWIVEPEELVPALRDRSGWIDDRFTLGDYIVQRYRRRLETSHDRIERWLHQPSGQTHWRVVDRNNVTSLYGSTDETRVSDPADSTRILRWLLTERFDDRGNIMRFVYKRENLEGVDLGESYERCRIDTPDAHGGTRYLKRVQYGNSAPHDRFNWHFEVVLDYGDHNIDNPKVAEDTAWGTRVDPYSHHRGGFESRVWRQCRRVLMFHRFDELGTEPVLVGATELGYRSQDGVSMLVALGYTGYAGSGRTRTAKRLPPMVFRYDPATVETAHAQVESDALANAFADGSAHTQWIDLEGTGMPGVAVRSGETWEYIRNLGDARFSDPEALPQTAHLRLLDDEVIDLTDEGQEDLAHERQYVPLTTLRSTANPNQDDPFVGYLDLNGDQADDVVVADDHVIRWYPSQGEDGFADPVVLRLDLHEASASRQLHTDARQSLHMADMTGDGLLDLVRVRSDEIVYWPNHGRGRFGNPVAMADGPRLAHNATGNGRTLLADLTGNGLADVVWIGDDSLHIWRNDGGNRLQPVHVVDAPGCGAEPAAVKAVDLFGCGVAALVWVDRRAETVVRYATPFGRKRSGFLVGISNNRGAEVHIAYTDTTESWRNDRDADVEWLVTSSSPVSVVRRVEYFDDTSSTHRARTYRFRHAYFDELDRKFAGFAYAECADGDGLPTRITKSWRHVGVSINGREVAEQLLGDDASTPATDPVVVARALRGRLLSRRIEPTSEDPSKQFLLRRDCTWRVRQVQPVRAGKPAVYDVRIGEVIDAEAGRDVENAKVTHELTLSVDDYGTILQTARVSYPARKPTHELQARGTVTISETLVANRTDQSTWHRFAVPLGHIEWELGNLPLTSRIDVVQLRQAFAEATVVNDDDDAKGIWKRCIEHVRIRYLSNDMNRVIEPGGVESKALVAYQERLAFDDHLVAELYADVPDVEKLLTSQGGYRHLEDKWWALQERYTYDASRFYAVSAVMGPHGGRIRWRYDAPTLALVETEDPFGNVTRLDVHPRTRQGWLHVDQNGNVRGRRYDALGAVLSDTVAGKSGVGELDVIVTTSLEPSAGDNPTIVTTYDVNAWLTAGDPAWVRTRTRTVHGDAETQLEERIEHFDGFDRLAGCAQRRADGTWLVSQLVQRDARGRIICEAEPFISDVPWPSEDERKQALVEGTKYLRDALGRVLRTDHSDGTISWTEYEPWQVSRWDRNDTVMESRWYKDRQGASRGRASEFGSQEMVLRQHQTRAGALAAAHARTPAIEMLSTDGLVGVVHQIVSDRNAIDHAVRRDRHGRVVTVLDGQGREVLRCRFDLIGNPVEVIYGDRSSRRTLWTASGEPLWSLDTSGRGIATRHDVLGRRTHVYGIGAKGAALIERTIWGGGDVGMPDAAKLNVVGTPAVVLSSGGIYRVERDHSGRPVRESYRKPAGATMKLDLLAAETAASVEQIEVLLDATGEGGTGGLASSAFTVVTEYDVLGRVVARTGPSGAQVNYQRSLIGWIERIESRTSGGAEQKTLVSSAEYDAHGRVRVVRLGDSVEIRRDYDTSGNLVGITAWARGADRPLQDLRITYDAVGNPLSVLEKGHLMASYAYDSLYRLTKVEGLEPVDGPDGRVGVRQFSRAYEYDAESNIASEHYRAGDIQSDTRYAYGLGSVLQSEGDDDAVAYTHDEMGRLVDALGDRLTWDVASRLAAVDSTDGSKTELAYLPGDGPYRRRTVQDSDVTDVLRIGEFERSVTLHEEAVIDDVYTTRVCLGDLLIAVIRHAVSRSELSQFDVERSVRFQLADISGSPVVEVAEDGEVIDQEWFLPWGQTLHRRGRSEAELAAKRIGFRGAWRDADSDLLHLDGEWYVPRLGRFANRRVRYDALHSPFVALPLHAPTLWV